VQAAETKARLRSLAYGQAKVADAAVTFIVCGVLPDHAAIPERLDSFVKAGFMSAEVASGWQEGARALYADPRIARDEAVRSATFGAATLIYAAEALGLVSGPMVGFDAEGVTREFGLAPSELPVLLVAVGRAAPGNWPQKPRRPLTDVLEIA
jgi:nitroreductase